MRGLRKTIVVSKNGRPTRMVVAEVISNRLLESSMKGDLKSIQYVAQSDEDGAATETANSDSRPAISIFRTRTAFVSSSGGCAIWSTRMNEMAALPEANSLAGC